MSAFEEYQIDGWSEFEELASQFKDHSDAFVWRGQRRADWALRPSLHRLIGSPSQRSAQRQLFHFKRALQRLRGTTILLQTDGVIWALGQHHGLATPLLDWTSDPNVAAYFAFAHSAPKQRTRRIVFALNCSAIERYNVELRAEYQADKDEDVVPGDLDIPTLDVFSPSATGNPNMQRQKGLFTIAPYDETLEGWINQQMPPPAEPVLVKIRVLNAARMTFLKQLTSLNVHAMELFPDVYGAARLCNQCLVEPGHEPPWFHFD